MNSTSEVLQLDIRSDIFVSVQEKSSLVGLTSFFVVVQNFPHTESLPSGASFVPVVPVISSSTMIFNSLKKSQNRVLICFALSSQTTEKCTLVENELIENEFLAYRKFHKTSFTGVEHR